MPAVEIKDKSNKVTGKMDLPDAKFSVSGHDPLVHEAVVNYLANQRQGTHATKTKGLVSGGGKKPWKQKHTGRARAGSNRSPLWRGGGTVFGPLPRDYSYQMPKTARRVAFFAALSGKIKDGALTVVDGLKVEKPRTREMVAVLKAMGLSDKKVLLVLSEPDDALMLSVRNIANMDVVMAADLNVYDVVSAGHILVTKGAVEALEARPL